MNLILLSGGSGQRLWPLSNNSRSKQFLKLLGDKDNEHKKSMLERVWSQLEQCSLSDRALISTSSSQIDMIKNQLGESVPLIVEPERRDTFPAIALAASYLLSVEGKQLDEIVAVLPVDPFVETKFFKKIMDLESLLIDSRANLGLIGVKPTYPSSKYGYIVPCGVSTNNEGGHLNVSHFHEKPTEEMANKLIAKNALWNTGVFGFKLGYIIDILVEKGFSTDYYTLLNQYNKLPKISFDYEVVERSNKILALSYEGYWKDLGTWNTLTEEMATNLIGKATLSEDSENTHIINELDIPIVALGLNNVVVAASPDGILVTDKNTSPRIKEYLNNYNHRPMFEERRWGWYQVIDFAKYDDRNEMLTKKLSILEGKNISYQYHETRNEVWTIVKGEGEFVLDDKILSVYPGDVLRIPVRARHSIRAKTSMEIIEVQTGFNLVEADNFRVHEDWKKILKHCLAVK